MTAGPTREMLDPVRFITNLSTGEMGYSIAAQAKRRGYSVTLISGPTALKPPAGVCFIPIVTVEELARELAKHFRRCDVLIMAAAVGDFIPIRQPSRKIHRQEKWKVGFRAAPDLVRQVATRKGRRLVIGFSLETENWLARSRRKLEAKHLDGMVANYFTARHNPFGRGPARVALMDRRGTRFLRLPSKSALAKQILVWAQTLKNYS